MSGERAGRRWIEGFWVGLLAVITAGRTSAQPFSTTQPAAPITGTQATLNGMATPNGSSSWAWFEWSVASAGCVTPPAGLTNWWAGGGNALDLTGNNHGTWQSGTNGAAPIGVVFGQGKVGSAFSFDGVHTNIVRLTNAAGLQPPWSAEVWVNRQVSTSSASVLIGDTNTAIKLEQTNQGGKVGFTKWNGPSVSGTDFIFNYVAPTGSWAHLVFVASTTNMLLYTNGVLVPGFLAPTNITSNLAVGRERIGDASPGTGREGGRQIKGLIDELSLYNRALTPAEIQGLYYAGADGKCGTNLNYGQATTPISVGSGSQVVRVSATISNLLGGRIYHCRLVVSNAARVVVRGADVPFLAGGQVFAAGLNDGGQINVPLGLNNAVAVSGGAGFSLALRSDQTVIPWGTNDQGQTALPPGLTNVMTIAAGGYHALALLSNGRITAWGASGSGQTNVLASLSNVVAIAAGASNSLALRADGTVVRWGDNSFGQSNGVPANLSNIVAIAAGANHCLALRNNGTVAAWGANSSGQSSVPVGLTNVVAIAAGGNNSVALRSDSTVLVWSNASLSLEPNEGTNLVAVAAGSEQILGIPITIGSPVGWPLTAESLGLMGPYIAGSIAAGAYHNLAIGVANDNFADRFPIAGTNILFVGCNINATTQSGEPQHASLPSSNSVWFTWVAPNDGGVVITADSQTEAPLDSPILAAYTGSNFGTFIRVASNAVPDLSAPVSAARLAFTVVSNTAYQIAVDGCNTNGNLGYGTLGQGTIRLALTYSHPPTNDQFANALPIQGLFYETTGSFLGASREVGEPSHGDTNLQQTLWWSWIAPTNLGATNIPVRLTVEGSGFTPGIGVYVGNSVSNPPFAANFSSRQTNIVNANGHYNVVTTNGVYTNGTSSTALFNAGAGTTYNIALAGRETADNNVITNFGNFRFRLNSRFLSLTLTNLIASPLDSSNNTPFTADALITDSGTATSNPVRIYVSAIAGDSLRGTGLESCFDLSTSEMFLNIWPTNGIRTVGPGQSILVTNITGVAPAPTYPQGNLSTPCAAGWGVYAQLQEQLAGATNWNTVDEALILYGKSPDFAGDIGLPQPIGPGGGVVTLSPAGAGLGAFDPLKSVVIVGSNAVPEGGSAQYYGLATFTAGDTSTFTQTVWTATPFKITNGFFTAGLVTSNTIVGISAQYTNYGILYSVSTNVTVLPFNFLALGPLTNHTFALRLTNGIPGKSNFIQVNTNLACTSCWVTLLTNVFPASGVLNTNLTLTNSRGFFRAREFP